MIKVTEEMLSTGQPIAQGEVLIWAKKYAPQSVLNAIASLKMTKELKLENQQLILGHSETGHHHVLEAARLDTPISKAAIALIDDANDLYVDLKLLEECKVVHERGTDTHKGFLLPAGEYIKGTRQEQNQISGWVQVRD